MLQMRIAAGALPTAGMMNDIADDHSHAVLVHS